MRDSVQYIIRFLLGDDIPGELIPAIGYTDDQRLYGKFSIVIKPSGFFTGVMYGKPASIPSLPLSLIDSIPLLFGEPVEEMSGDTLVLHADLIASTFFLITRYEEMVRRDIRDENGRFPGKESTPYRGGFIHRPVVDEYGIYLRNKLRQLGARLPEEKSGIRKLYLTHDIDSPFYCRSWRNVFRELIKGNNILDTLRIKFGKLEHDPYYTFPDIFEENKQALERFGNKRGKIICFFKAGGNTAKDKPVYKLSGKDMKRLFSLCTEHQVETGLHSSYQAGIQPERIKKEKKYLETAAGKQIRINRHHYLANREPEHMMELLKAGIEEDYTMGYANVAGFRLGTCRPVHWIDPLTRKLTELLLHPLTVMECSLSEEKYMNLTYEDALNYCFGLIDQTARHKGELVLLWHNTAFSMYETKYLKQLYSVLLNKITNL